MRNEKEIQEKKDKDIQFIISAVTAELHDTAYLNYFCAWEQNGGMGWFFTECVEITHKIMLTEGSAYLKWLDHWKETEGNDWVSFSELIGECFDWYHMYAAREEFESRYEKDECNKSQVSEAIGYFINSFKTKADRDEVMGMAIKFAKKEREDKKKREKLAEERREEQERKKKAAYDKIINDLKELDVDGETMQDILEKVGMDEQMHRQLVLTADSDKTKSLLEEKRELDGER